MTKKAVAKKQAGGKTSASKTTTPAPVQVIHKLTDAKIIHVSPDDLDTSLKTNFVRRFDPVKEDYHKLKESIKQQGRPYGKVGLILEPIAAAPIEGKPGKYLVERGNQRTKIAKELNATATSEAAKMTVPVIVVNGPMDHGNILARQAAENINAGWTSVDRGITAKGLRDYYDGSTPERPQMTDAEIGTIIGVSADTVRDLVLVVERLSTNELQEIHAGVIPFRAARKLARVKDKETRRKALEAAKAAKEKARAAADKKKAEAEKKGDKKAAAKAAKEGDKKAAAAASKAVDDVIKDIPAEGKVDPGRAAGQTKRASTKKAAANGATAGMNFKCTMQEAYDLMQQEFLAGAHGKLAKEVAGAMGRFFQTGDVDVLGDELASIEEDLTGKKIGGGE